MLATAAAAMITVSIVDLFVHIAEDIGLEHTLYMSMCGAATVVCAKQIGNYFFAGGKGEQVGGRVLGWVGGRGEGGDRVLRGRVGGWVSWEMKVWVGGWMGWWVVIRGATAACVWMYVCVCVYMYVLGSLYWEHAYMGATPAIIAFVRATPPRLHV